jgi:transcriptional regulator with XRE-family HTH domain
MRKSKRFAAIPSFAALLRRQDTCQVGLQERNKGPTEADVAAKIWGQNIKDDGSTEATGSAMIGLWLSGKLLPSLATFAKLAAALDVEVVELEPDEEMRAVPRDAPTLTPLSYPKDTMFLDIHQFLPTAHQILELVEAAA